MTTDLEPRIRELFRELADQTAVTPDVHPAGVVSGRTGDRRVGVSVASAAAILALVAAAVVVVVPFSRNDIGTAPAEEYGDPVGIFPAGDAERVVAIGYRSAADVAAAYLSNRFPATDPAKVMDVLINAPLLSDDDSRAIVAFQVSTDNDSDHIIGRLDARRVMAQSGDTGWAVLVMSIGGANASEMRLDGDELTGSLSGTEPGERIVIVRDAQSGDVLADVGFSGPRPLDGEVAFDELAFDLPVRPGAVTVQMWNLADGQGRDRPGGRPEYMEVLVREGDEPTSDAFDAVRESVEYEGGGPFADDLISAVGALGESGDQPIADGDGFALSLSGGTAVDGGEVTLDQYCLDVVAAPGGYSICRGPIAEASTGTLTMFGRTARDRVGLVVALVPDTVASVADERGRELPLAHNVFYDPVSPGVHTYLLESDDGTRLEAMTFTYLVLGAELVFFA